MLFFLWAITAWVAAGLSSSAGVITIRAECACVRARQIAAAAQASARVRSLLIHLETVESDV